MRDLGELGCIAMLIATVAVLAWMFKDVLFGIGYH